MDDSDNDNDMYYYMMYFSSSHTCDSIAEYPAGTNWQDAFDFCEETGMRSIASRDDTDWVGSCEYNSNTSNMEWYTYPRAVDISVWVEQGRTYWVSVTGARNHGARNALSRARRRSLAPVPPARPQLALRCHPLPARRQIDD